MNWRIVFAVLLAAFAAPAVGQSPGAPPDPDALYREFGLASDLERVRILVSLSELAAGFHGAARRAAAAATRGADFAHVARAEQAIEAAESAKRAAELARKSAEEAREIARVADVFVRRANGWAGAALRMAARARLIAVDDGLVKGSQEWMDRVAKRETEAWMALKWDRNIDRWAKGLGLEATVAEEEAEEALTIAHGAEIKAVERWLLRSPVSVETFAQELAKAEAEVEEERR